jgi:hypothetical protein
LDNNPITKIPKPFIRKEMIIKLLLLILDKPNIAIPSSSGSGDAIIRAPIDGRNCLKRWVLNIEKNLLLLGNDNRKLISLATLSLTK